LSYDQNCFSLCPRSDRQVIIEEDNFEEGLVDTLIAAGIKKEDIVTSWQSNIYSIGLQS
jgi:hypothetical protein